MKIGRSLAVGEVSLYSEGTREPVAHAVGTYSIPPAPKNHPWMSCHSWILERNTLSTSHSSLHLPPVTTVTLYKGAAPVGFLHRRLAMMLGKNPWLTSRIVKKNTTDRVVSPAYTKAFELEPVISQHALWSTDTLFVARKMRTLETCNRWRWTVVPEDGRSDWNRRNGRQSGHYFVAGYNVTGFALVVSMNLYWESTCSHFTLPHNTSTIALCMVDANRDGSRCKEWKFYMYSRHLLFRNIQ